MSRNRIVISCLLAILVCSLSLGAANDRHTNYMITMKSLGQKPDSLSHVSEWHATLRGRSNIVLHWKCGPFFLENSDKVHCDTVMTLDVLSTRGALTASPRHATAQTNCEAKVYDATVSTSVSGMGFMAMHLQLDLTSPFPAAGEYINTVELSVTAH